MKKIKLKVTHIACLSKNVDYNNFPVEVTPDVKKHRS